MLSQAEIDALLAGTIDIGSSSDVETINLAEVMNQTLDEENNPTPSSRDMPDAPPKKKATGRQVRPYNFWSPDRFSKEQMRAVEMVHEDLAERLTASLPSFLRTNLKPRVVHSEQGRFHDFLRDLTSTSLFHLITLSPLPGHIVITISPEISYAILELLLGGKMATTRSERKFTDIDQLLLQGMVEYMLSDIKAAWSKLSAIEPGLDDTTVNYHWVQMVMGNERVMLITFELAMQSITGTMNVYIPFTTLKPIASVLNPYLLISSQKERLPNLDDQNIVRENLTRITMPIRVLLGNAKLTVSEIGRLKEGDVIRLDRMVDQAVPVEGKTRFMAKVGQSNNRVAIQITDLIPVKEKDQL